MAEEPVSFGISDARRIDRVVGAVERNIIDAREPRKQKQFPGGNIELVHGVIIAACNTACGTYRVVRVRRTMRDGCDDCGSGSGSGS